MSAVKALHNTPEPVKIDIPSYVEVVESKTNFIDALTSLREDYGKINFDEINRKYSEWKRFPILPVQKIAASDYLLDNLYMVYPYINRYFSTDWSNRMLSPLLNQIYNADVDIKYFENTDISVNFKRRVYNNKGGWYESEHPISYVNFPQGAEYPFSSYSAEDIIEIKERLYHDYALLDMVFIYYKFYHNKTDNKK